MRRFSTGNAAVDALGYFSITGNVTPNNWYKRITRENGKPNLLAIALLSDIVYWYRPEEIRDEQSGNTVGWRKKFRGDLLQKSYNDYADFFGESKRSIKAALDYLEDLGVIKKLFRDIRTETNNILYNMMFIELIPQELEKLTFDVIEENRELDTPCNEMYPPIQNNVGGYTTECTTPLQNDVRGDTKECGGPIQQDVPPLTIDCRTNTENTTEITNRDNNIIILSSDRQETPRDQSVLTTEMMNNISDKQRAIKERETYISLIRKNIGYDILMKERKTDKELLEELFQIICDVVCNKREKIEVNKTLYDYETVKAQFLKINIEHIRCVLLSMKENVSKINNMHGYLITALYNSVHTIGHYYQSKVNYDWQGDGRIDLEWGNQKSGGAY